LFNNALHLSKKNTYLKLNVMGNLLYLVAVVFVILWVIGFFFGGFGPNVGNLIHILLVIAIIAILLKVINRTT
jgi:hypothetical protein